MLHVALLEPEIAGNAGTIARTCLAAGAELHLIRPLGFRLGEAGLRRAGMDYWDLADVSIHAGFDAFREQFGKAFENERVFAFTTKATSRYTRTSFRAGDVMLFGPESRGLPDPVRRTTVNLRIPMAKETRSLNLAVSVGIALYEAGRQLGFPSGT